MIIRKFLFFFIFFLSMVQALCGLPLAEQLKQVGYVELSDKKHSLAPFKTLYVYFDEFIAFLQKNSTWRQKLYSAKERFIRTKEREYYSTDFFGFYDESLRAGRAQIAFYYSVHFHEFIFTHYPELARIPEIINFLRICFEIQKSYTDVFNRIAVTLGVEAIFSSLDGQPPILFKVIKYLPSYCATRPHYDGAAFSLFLDSTDNQSLLLSPYKSLCTVDDFFSPSRECSSDQSQNSMLLIPGAYLAEEYSIYPTPHIVVRSGKTRYATVAFAMRPHYKPRKNEFSPLPDFKN